MWLPLRRAAGLAALLVTAASSQMAAAATATGGGERTAPAPGAVSAAGAPDGVPAPGHEIGLGSLQLVAGYGAELGGLVGLAALGLRPQELGFQSDYANLAMVAALAPALAGAAVCGTGYLSRWYRGRCSTTFLGAYAGAALGLLLGVAMAPSPGPDDTVEFSRTVSGMFGVLLLTPVGALIGYHAGKRPIERESAHASAQESAVPSASPPLGSETAAAFAAQRPGPAFVYGATRSLILPVIAVSW